MGSDKKNIVRTKSRKRLKQEKTAKLVINPALSNSAVIKAYTPGIDNLNVAALNNEIKRINIEIKDGDLKRAEEIYVAQAHALDAIFTALAVKATQYKQAKHVEAYASLALKAQRQCKATLDSLINLKKPKVYVKNLINNQNNANFAQLGDHSPTPTDFTKIQNAQNAIKIGYNEPLPEYNFNQNEMIYGGELLHAGA